MMGLRVNQNPALVKVREQFNGVVPVGRDLPIAIKTATQRTLSTQVGGKINPAGPKPFSVFPKALEAVKVGTLYFSAPRSQGGGFWAAQTFRSAPLQSLVISTRSIPYLAISTSSISSVSKPGKSPSPYQAVCEVNKTRPLFSPAATPASHSRVFMPGT